MSGYEEKRRFRRIPDSFIVTYELKSPRQVLLQSGEHDAIALDVSEGGLGLDSGTEIPVGAQVQLRFRMLNEHSALEADRRREIVVDGESRYCSLTDPHNFRVGLLFTNLSDEDRAFLARYIKDQSLAQKK